MVSKFKMLKQLICTITIVTVSCFLISFSAFAAETIIYHYDTDDYCLFVQDVNLKMSEIQAYEDETKLQDYIIRKAEPAVRIRSSPEKWENWTLLTTDQLTFDFSQFIPQAGDTGYPVTVTAPSIHMDAPSAITFNVYVTDDRPGPVIATIQFANTDITELKMDITDGAILTYRETEVPLKEGYFFTGWYLDESGTQPFLLPDSAEYAEQAITGDLILYPGWQPVSSPLPPKPSAAGAEPTLQAPSSPSVLSVEGSYESSYESSHESVEKQEKSETVHLQEAVIQQIPSSMGEMMPPGKGGINPMEMVLLLAESVLGLFLGGSILSDLRVLRWYANKKQERGMSV